MKKCFSIIFICAFLISCDNPPSNTNPPTRYSPVLMNRTDMEASVKFIEVQPIKKPGKIYLKDNYIFLNEKYKGIHIIDNTNPQSPVKLGFIQIPGNIDIGINGNVLFADNATDLVSIDLGPGIYKEIGRVKNAFPELLPPDLGYLPKAFTTENRPENFVIVDWKIEN